MSSTAGTTREASADPGSSETGIPSIPEDTEGSAESAATASAESAVAGGEGDGFRIREPVVLYSSISVDCLLPSAETVKGGSLQLLERDLGSKNDFWNIHVNFVWKPRGLKSGLAGSQVINVSIDDFLTLRLCLEKSPPSATIHLKGGQRLGEFRFPNGPDAAVEFWRALKERVEGLPLLDDFCPPQLFLIEKKPRMRRAVPSLGDTTSALSQVDEDYASLLQDLRLQAPGSRRAPGVRRIHNRGNNKPEDFGLMILSQFAKVTQAAREVGDEISTLLDEKKRRAEAERKERERAARRRALDIYSEIVASTDVERELPPRLTLDEKRGESVSVETWRASSDKSGKFTDPAVMKQAIFAGGLESSLRSEAWPFILGLFTWTSSASERDAVLRQKRREYNSLKEKWLSLRSAAQDADTISLAKDDQAITVDRRQRVSKAHADYLETEEQIAKDIVRTDRHLDLYMQDDAPATLLMGTLLNVYATYDNRITYCQGMSDFLSPILSVTGVQHEALAFWCFANLMQRIEGNFRVDQSGMRMQLKKLKQLIELMDEQLAAFFEESDPDYYCCFRWIVVRFKRELSFGATTRMWEALWTQQVAGDDLHIFVAGALLVAHRRQLLSLPRGAFDSLLRYVNDMSMRIDVDFALREGELCFRRWGAMIT